MRPIYQQATIIFFRVLRKIGLLGNVNLSANTFVNGSKFKIPVVNGIGISNFDISEPWMIQLLEVVIPINKGLFVDVGVNIGQTLIKVKSVSPNIEYLGFEPNTSCLYYLSKLVKQNKLENVTILPIGISENTEVGVLNFYNKTEFDSSASTLADFRDKSVIERKEFIPLFDFSVATENIDVSSVSVLKIDVEGAELEVLKTAKSFMLDANPVILLEILPAYNEENTNRLSRQVEIVRLLTDLNYSIYLVKKNDNMLTGFVEIEKIEIHSNLTECDYVAVPAIKKAVFLGYCAEANLFMSNLE